jgi:hypothetical protein
LVVKSVVDAENVEGVKIDVVATVAVLENTKGLKEVEGPELVGVGVLVVGKLDELKDELEEPGLEETGVDEEPEGVGVSLELELLESEMDSDEEDEGADSGVDVGVGEDVGVGVGVGVGEASEELPDPTDPPESIPRTHAAASSPSTCI